MAQPISIIPPFFPSCHLWPGTIIVLLILDQKLAQFAPYHIIIAGYSQQHQTVIEMILRLFVPPPPHVPMGSVLPSNRSEKTIFF